MSTNLVTLAKLFVAVAVGVAVGVLWVIFGVPPFGTPGTTTKWTVYSCPDDPECVVDIDVKSVSSGCTIEVSDFIDRNPNKKNQTIVWRIPNNPTGYDVRFKDPGINMTEGAGDMDDVKKDKKEHKKKVKKKDPDRTFLTYDILIEYKANSDPGTVYTPCTPKGPAIVNRG